MEKYFLKSKHQSAHTVWNHYIRVVQGLSFGVTQTKFQALFCFLLAVFLGKFLTSSSKSWFSQLSSELKDNYCIHFQRKPVEIIDIRPSVQYHYVYSINVRH